jgi:hypothetical protein
MLDSLVTVLHTHVVGKITILHILIMVAGTVFPILLGLILPRKHTIQYGIAIDKFLGLALLQKRIFGGNIPGNIIEKTIQTIQTTFQDVSFGVYIESRKDLTEEQRTQKIDEYLKNTANPKP